MANAPPDVLARIQAKKFERYRLMIGGNSVAGFWDVVLITAADEDQARLYRTQIMSRAEMGYLPASAQYHVISDPPGPKIGNGGATLVALDWLRFKFSDGLKSLKVLLIHAGGYSQRTPNHSVCGKIFAPLPVGPMPGSTMLEMCLAMLCDIPKRACPGVMVKCGDDIIVFDSDHVDLTRQGFTALGHRSPLAVAHTHGVFCLSGRLGEGSSVQCRRFTHKPSLEKMRKYGALLDGKEDEAYTDSSFFFDWNSADKLLAWYDMRDKKIGCEIDAYGDFLQALGPEGDSEYCTDDRNALAAGSTSAEMRKQVFEVLRGVELSVCLLDQSRFWHIGTLPELLHHFCARDSFLEEAGGLDPIANYTFKDGEHCCPAHQPSAAPCDLSDFYLPKNVVTRAPFIARAHGLLYYSDDAPRPAVVCSRVDVTSHVSPGSFVELSILGKNCSVGQGSFVSSSVLMDDTVVPNDIFLHTLAVHGANQNLTRRTELNVYVTHILGIEDNIKATGTADQVTWAGIPLNDVCLRAGLLSENIWDGKLEGSLWDARLFPLASKREQSAHLSLSLLKAATTGKSSSSGQGDWDGITFTSLKESMSLKDSMSQLSHRKNCTS